LVKVKTDCLDQSIQMVICDNEAILGGRQL